MGQQIHISLSLYKSISKTVKFSQRVQIPHNGLLSSGPLTIYPNGLFYKMNLGKPQNILLNTEWGKTRYTVLST